jgi:hypothetical protein
MLEWDNIIYQVCFSLPLFELMIVNYFVLQMVTKIASGRVDLISNFERYDRQMPWQRPCHYKSIPVSLFWKYIGNDSKCIFFT